MPPGVATLLTVQHKIISLFQRPRFMKGTFGKEVKMTPPEQKMVPLYLTDRQNYQLDLYAGILEISQEKLLEAIIASSFEDLDIMDKIGFLVKEVRLSDQIDMYKKLSREDINHIAQKHVED